MHLHYTQLLTVLLTSSSFFLSSVLAVEVLGTIAFNDVCKDIKELKATKVVLDGGKWKANVLRDGRFTFHDVEPGSYVLDVQARDFFFDQLRVDVLAVPPPPAETGATSPTAAEGNATPSSTSFVVEARPLPLGVPHYPIPPAPEPARLAYPIILHPRASKVYVTPKADFSVVAMFKGNPMLLMMLGMIGMMFLMPKILASMDPEEKKEFLAKQNQMMSVQNSMKDMDLGGGIAKLLSSGANDAASLKVDSKDSQPTGSTPQPAPSPSKKSKHKKR